MSEAIIRIAGRGDGVTATGRHVPWTAPGDMVDVAGAIIERGPHHIDPACRHFTSCGGCQLQHLDDASYGQFIRDRIAQALAAQGVECPDFADPHLSPPESRRRATMKAARAGGRLLLGFNEAASHRLVDVRMCPVLRPELFALVAPLRDLLARLTVKPGATAAMTLCDQGADLTLGSVVAERLAAQEALTDFAQGQSLARLSLDQGYGPELQFQPEQPTVSFDGVAVALPADAFLQATADGEAALLAAVREIVDGAKTVADLFSGLGTFALPLSAKARVLAADAARDSILALGQAAARAQRPLKAIHRDLFRAPLQDEELQGCEAVVVDPPRAGAQAQAAELARSAVPVVAMVSCNPATFARDAKTLIAGGYRLTRIWPVGQFRWSTHVELVGAFSR